MGFEQIINQTLNNYPFIKRGVKRAYQRIMYGFSSKIKSSGDINRVSPDDGSEYFFGYYDKSPWDITDRYMLCMRAKNTWSDVSPKEKADILIIDTSLPENDTNRVKKIAETKSWNVQQGCMLQWLGSDFSSKIIYNDFRDGKYVSVIKEILTGTESVIPAPIYTVSNDGKTAFTLDFSRLYNLRPGYGYHNVPEKTEGVALPDATAVWKINLETGEVHEFFSYKDFVKFQPRPEMLGDGSVHKVNHLMISPDGNRCMVLYRWFAGHKKYTRLITFDTDDGSDMYLLSDDDMVSHCFWKNNEEILAFENKKSVGTGYFLMKDHTQEYIHCWPNLSNDGHPSYSMDGSMVVTDTYPDRARISEIKIMSGKDEKMSDVKVIAKVFSPFKYDNDTRCDLHPRWNYAGDRVCFDGVFEGHRGLYLIDVSKERQDVKENRILVCFMMTACKKCGPVQQMLNIIKDIDRETIEPVLLTIYPEPTDGSSQINKYLPYVTHYYAHTRKIDIVFGRTEKIDKVLSDIHPDVIHSLGVFPDYAISRIRKYPQIITLRNYIWDDYPAKYGRIRGTILARLHIYAMRHADKTVTCSRSLSEAYKKGMHLTYDYVINGVDTYIFKKTSDEERIKIRRQAGIPCSSFVFVYSGQFIKRKNQSFLLSVFREAFQSSDIYLLMLGDGPDYQELYDEFGNIDNIDFRGDVDDVSHYLKASDAYVSTSKSEGMPNGVLEAMATGLPVVLSDINQHTEIFKANPGIGYTYKQNDTTDLSDKMKKILSGDYRGMGERAYDLANNKFNAKKMSEKYQRLYKELYR